MAETVSNRKPVEQWKNYHYQNAARYTRKLSDYIIGQLETGRTLTDICREEGIPSYATIMKWVVEDKDTQYFRGGFGVRFARAREIAAQRMADEIVEIADDGRNDTYTDEDGFDRPNYDVIKRSELRIKTRQWLMGKRLPDEFGDKSKVDVKITLESLLGQVETRMQQLPAPTIDGKATELPEIPPKLPQKR